MKLGNPEVIQYILLLVPRTKSLTILLGVYKYSTKIYITLHPCFHYRSIKIVKALLGAVTMFVCSIMQARLKPYKIKVVSDLGSFNTKTLKIYKFIEHREMISSILTIYGGLIFVQEDNNLSFLRVTIFVGIVIANLRFISNVDLLNCNSLQALQILR